ncbi:MAG: CbiX/SirB N-terminal domain-containing protein [Betaproteobacteria bacterium]|nr:CbiX/SirB N-terminal domain-containing protein [Betaproteobacteria bacterium]
MKQGILMVAHGARAAGWDAPFQAVLARLRASGEPAEYALAFLEHKAPPVADAVHALVRAGCTQVRLVPMLLGVGAHARDDLPRLLAEARAAHPQVQFSLSTTLGESEAMLAAMTQFVRAAGASPDA